ncbi:ATP-dependent Clp protease ATP-binding subunit [Candidatus Poribacteria bacterium]|nr:ATP-dependent Clp protease ATP-binding subunit [Candidatus Poribacteria bacterium]
MFETFTQRAKKVLNMARKEAMKLNHDYVETEHVLLGLVSDGEGIAAITLQNLGIDMESVKIEVEEMVVYGSSVLSIGEKPFSPAARKAIELAANEARNLGHNYIGTEHLLLGLIKEEEGIANKVLQNLGATYDKVEKEIMHILGGQESSVFGKKQKDKTSILDEFGRDLTALAKEDKLDPVIKRDNEIERIIQILSRRTKNNPVLIGEPGVGKTAIVEGLAQRIISGQVPALLQDKQLFSIDLALVVAGTKYRGQFEERFKTIMKEVKQADGKIILFIDEIHMLIGAGAAEGAIDASNMLKPSLSRGDIQCIGATTIDEYRKYIEKDGALERRFQPVAIPPTDKEQTIKIIQGLKHKYEAHHNVKISDEAIIAAVELSDRYLTERFLPDKAIDLIDEASSKARLGILDHIDNLSDIEKQISIYKQKKEEAIKEQNFEKAAEMRDKERELKFLIAKAEEKNGSKKKNENPVLTVEDIAYVVSRWTGIPVTKMTENDTRRLINMENDIHKNFIGQDKAVKTISQAIRRSKAKLKDPKRPIGSFIFLGPTGVGKTKLARSLAEFLFGDENALITFDMSEYQEKFSISRLIGSPPGYVGYEEGGLLTEKIRRKPYSVILLDEIEKANPDIFSIFLQILENGRLTDSLGHEVDFRNTIIIMTSNIGARVIEKNTTLGFISSDSIKSYDKIKEKVMEEVKNVFRPEFLNRIDEIIVFNMLSNTELKKIVDILIKDLEKSTEKKIKLILSEQAKDFIISHRDNPSYGARSLKRTIQKYIEDPLTESILTDKIQDEMSIKIDEDNENLSFSIEENNLELAISSSGVI